MPSAKGYEDFRITVPGGIGGINAGGFYQGVYAGDVTNIATTRGTLYAVPFPTGASSTVATRMFVRNGNVNSASVRLAIFTARSDAYSDSCRGS